ncbi:MAG TPA: hypothetical protein VGQ69_11330 [Gemmatimonadales bacterium]|nr:hypothetical protein [Gemmatimonadales bacterium]
MTELAGDQLDRHAGAELLDRPMMAGVMEPVPLEAKGAATLTVVVAGLPTVEGSEKSLTGSKGL